MEKDKLEEMRTEVESLKRIVSQFAADNHAATVQLIEKKFEYLSTHIDILLRAVANLITLLIPAYISTFAFSVSISELTTLRFLLLLAVALSTMFVFALWRIRQKLVKDTFNEIHASTSKYFEHQYQRLDRELLVVEKRAVNELNNMANFKKY